MNHRREYLREGSLRNPRGRFAMKAKKTRLARFSTGARVNITSDIIGRIPGETTGPDRDGRGIDG
jgi:hypothetical protein